MLVRYTESNHKTTMGLLSCVSGIDSLDQVNDTLQYFTNRNDRYIYLDQQDQQFIGVVLVILQKDFVIIDRLGFIPDEETVFNENEVLRSLQSIYPERRLIGTIATSSMMERFEMGQNINGTNE
ncbi:hypothetical protein [Pediococcus argentinicus]|nr:hypothetical protein [Pediococcus argentinicus]NKZ21530.1 riboflavin biosynthesis protein RibT [Pediococcus argentinicus]GEP18671.1 hypothetical protein LSA03_00550 [Pediococcus argentinicus]